MLPSGPATGIAMIERILPAQRRYSLTKVRVAQGDLAVGSWRPRKIHASDDAPVVMAVHGITGNHRCWPYLADSLPWARLIAPDLRGRGQSADIRTGFGMATHADDVIRVLDHLGVERAVLVGHSMGGFVTSVAAHRHPDRVSALVLVDGGMPITAEIPDDPQIVSSQTTEHLKRRLQMTFRSEEDAVRWWQTHPAFLGSWSPVIADYAAYDLGGRRPRLRSRASLKGLLEDSADIICGTDLRDAMDALAHPATWLTASRGLLGEPPGLYPPELLVHWVERYPQVTVVPVQDVNHYTIVLSRAGAEAIADAVAAYAAPPPVT